MPSELPVSLRANSGRHANLKELMNSFDETLDKALGGLTDSLVEMQTAHLLTQRELVSNDPVWRTWSRNLSDVMSVDWSQSSIRKHFVLSFPIIRSPAQPQIKSRAEEVVDQVHIKSAIPYGEHLLSDDLTAAVPTSDDVLREIDMIMNEEPKLGDSLRAAAPQCSTHDALEVVLAAMESQLKSLPTVYADNLSDMNVTELIDLSTDLDKLSQQLSDILVHALAERDELQYEKEVKNNFISALLAVDDRKKKLTVFCEVGNNKSLASKLSTRKSKSSYNLFGSSSSFLAPPSPPSTNSSSMTTPRHYRQQAARKARDAVSSIVSSTQNKYLRTTIIPYQPGQVLTVHHFQAITKILQAMLKDNPATLTLLTDYILNLVCPRE